MNEKLQEAIQLIEQGKSEEGIQKAEKLVKEADDETKRTAAELFYELGLVDRSLEIIEELMFRYPDHGELFAFAAECYGELGKEDEAIEMLSEIKEDDPAFLQAQLLLADIYQNQGLEEVAEQKLIQAQKLAPEEPVLQYGLGEFYLNRGDYLQSIPYFKKVVHNEKFLQDHPLNPALRIAEAYSATGQFEEALDYYQQGLGKEETPEGLFGFGITALQVKDYETATKQLIQLKDLDPDFTTLYPYLGKALREQSFLNEALDILQEGLKRDEFNEDLYLEMAKVQFLKGNGEAGKDFLQKVIALNPSNVSAVKELFVYFMEEEDYEDVLDLMEFLDDYGEYDPLFERYKAKALYETDDLDGAVQAYEKAIEDGDDQDSTLLEEAGFAYLEVGKKKEGISILEKLLSLEPERYDIEERIIQLKQNDM
ncbi:tetratricopeptide repeat protein [Bacillus shivajii]|uniref:tetratricopeptide repeat protein n=1 Tax=Bacillus shivajii TaxID=1983719 RepID=UPI001CFBFC99|nr:tetratricopeptide repeat protein [Bacillus shivajii]UCZ54790.1 tetratricopeptide repeat protein [Bacillus shivajii]